MAIAKEHIEKPMVERVPLSPVSSQEEIVSSSHEPFTPKILYSIDGVSSPTPDEIRQGPMRKRTEAKWATLVESDWFQDILNERRERRRVTERRESPANNSASRTVSAAEQGSKPVSPGAVVQTAEERYLRSQTEKADRVERAIASVRAEREAKLARLNAQGTQVSESRGTLVNTLKARVDKLLGKPQADSVK